MARLAIRLTPRAGLDLIEGPGPSGELEARVRAAPGDGAANEALLRLVARTLHVRRSAVELVSGARNRHKLVQVSGVALEEVLSRLAAARVPPRTGMLAAAGPSAGAGTTRTEAPAGRGRRAR